MVYLYYILNIFNSDICNKSCSICIEKYNPEDTVIKLSCNHSFNYEAILYDTIYQKKYNKLETNRIKKYQIKCPYCRNIQNGLLFWKKPYDKINNINWPPSKWYKSNICKFIPKKGKNKNIRCAYKCINNYCKKHSYTKCQATIRSGNRKGEICNAKASQIHNSIHYCKRHFKTIPV